MNNNLLELVGEGIGTVIGWVNQVLEAMIDWGWAGPSEWTVILAAIGIVSLIGAKIFNR